MPTFNEQIVDDSGYRRPVGGAQVYLLDSAGALAATSTPNPALTDDYGSFSFTASDGVYTFDARIGGGTIARGDAIIGNPPQYIGPPGPSNNTRINLAALKAASTGDVTSLYDGSLWTWTLGNYTGQADDKNIVASNAVPLSTGAWLRDMRAPRVSVLDYIPKTLRELVRRRTHQGDLTTYFQQACAAGSIVEVPAGDYYVSKVGIRDTVLVGDGHATNGTRILGTQGGTAADFMFDAMLNTDGVTPNTAGGGWAQNMQIIAPNGCTRSGMRTYGGGAYVFNIRQYGTQVGFSFGLPIWMTAHNLYAEGCKVVGYHTFSGAGDSATSLSMNSCWANGCYRGFHITQLIYSGFTSCVSQDAVERNWYVEGDANGVAACYSLTFQNCATEGTGVPFYFRKVRELVVSNPRIIQPDGTSHLMTLDDVQGKVEAYSTPGTPPGGKAHFNIINHGSGIGSIIADACAVSLASPSQRSAITAVGSIISGSRRTTSGEVIEIDSLDITERRYFDAANIDGFTGTRLMSADGTRLWAARRIGGVALSSNGPFSTPTTSLQVGDIVPYCTQAALVFQVRTPNGTMKTVTIPYDV